MDRPVIGIAGLTHLGICTSLAAAAKGFQVIGFDEDSNRTRQLAGGSLPIHEPQAQDLLDRHRAQLGFTADAGDLERCDVIFIARDVPTDGQGESDLSPVLSLMDKVAAHLRAGAIIVVLCQVPPGFTRGRILSPDRLFYQVETLVFGRAIERALEPERIIIGCADPGRALPPTYAAYLSAFGCPLLPMNYESAELAKIAINCCLVASVTIANTLAGLCEAIGADWNAIVPALKLDRRIGPHAYLAPGLGIAGGNLERDLATVLNLAAETGVETSVIRAYLSSSRHRRDWALRTLYKTVFSERSNPMLAILGLAYKENTDSIKNSPAVTLIGNLPPCGLRVYDPMVPQDAVTRERLVRAARAEHALEGADAAVVMTPWPEFAALDIAAFRAMNGRVIIDPYGAFDGAALKAHGFHYHRLGQRTDG